MIRPHINWIRGLEMRKAVADMALTAIAQTSIWRPRRMRRLARAALAELEKIDARKERR